MKSSGARALLHLHRGTAAATGRQRQRTRSIYSRVFCAHAALFPLPSRRAFSASSGTSESSLLSLLLLLPLLPPPPLRLRA